MAENKYKRVRLDIESVFSSAAWKAESIPAYPANYEGDSKSKTFVKLEILPSSQVEFYGNFDGVSGQVIIQIYVPAGMGMIALMDNADTLDTYFKSKTFANGTSTDSSTLNIIGKDSANPALFRGDYTVNFTLFN